jgi:hypothetical protein
MANAARNGKAKSAPAGVGGAVGKGLSKGRQERNRQRLIRLAEPFVKFKRAGGIAIVKIPNDTPAFGDVFNGFWLLVERDNLCVIPLTNLSACVGWIVSERGSQQYKRAA